jgi:hypothetical protein
MAGGKGKIHEHPNAGVNDFRKRPKDAGRPKMPDISEALEKVLNEEKDGIKALDAVLKALRTKAIKGDVRAIQELLDRAYGKSKQSVDHTTLGERLPVLNVQIVKPDES